MYEGDMLVSLNKIPEYEVAADVKIKHAMPGDKKKILDFIGENFSEVWIYEAEHALSQEFGKCFIATIDGKLVGFACYDACARGFFGPIGVLSEVRHKKIGKALFLRTLQAMKEYGYGYAIIGWVGEAAGFYEKVAGAKFIEGGEPENSVFSNNISM